MTTPDEAIARLRELHHNEPKMRCGARVTRRVEHYGGSVTERNLVCTLEPGHEEELHKDALCCWAFHRFGDAEPSPEDVWRGKACSCGRLDCATRAILDEVSTPS
ncbi:hypothetical protein SEA_SADLAD_74 [Microbacterium phage SadLad]|nr:hypothetical protein SEA_SADLAD_74 [Microbacterium phage SadLad]